MSENWSETSLEVVEANNIAICRQLNDWLVAAGHVSLQDFACCCICGTKGGALKQAHGKPGSWAHVRCTFEVNCVTCVTHGRAREERDEGVTKEDSSGSVCVEDRLPRAVGSPGPCSL